MKICLFENDSLILKLRIFNKKKDDIFYKLKFGYWKLFYLKEVLSELLKKNNFRLFLFNKK